MENIAEVYFRAWKKVSVEFIEVTLYLKFHLDSFEFQGGKDFPPERFLYQALKSFFPKERASSAVSRSNYMSCFECFPN